MISKELVIFAISLEQLTDFSPQVQLFNSLNLQLQGEGCFMHIN